MGDHSDQDEGQYYNYKQCDQLSHLATSNNIDGTSNKRTMMNYIPTYQSNTSDQWAKRQRSGIKSETVAQFKQARHLVKTVSDLPEFVAIESFKVASYQIAGEPHLCLPQLLQYLKQKFTLRRLVERFEKSMINFTSATLKQVDGFIKACVLPDDAKSCPLIKRSDADKVCLSLYEQCYKGKTNDIVKLCSMQQNPELRDTKNFIPINGGSDGIATSALNSGNSNSGGKDIDSILALAQAVTSTLMIRVYHRCFGKCVGIYYPSLLFSSKPSCIECVSCKIMFTPRRFIGHTHGSTERDLCHWGFNSYNWRHYIKLSSKQTMNNLGADELLIQFRTLQSAAHYIDNENIKDADDDDDYEFDNPDSENSKLNNTIDNNNKKTSAQMSWQTTNTTVNDLYQHNNLVERSKKPTTSTTTYPRASSSFYPSNTHYGATIPYYFAHCEGTSSRSASYNIDTVNTETKREIYVCSNLNSYLRSKGLNQSYIDDIVGNTLSIIRKSKSIT